MAKEQKRGNKEQRKPKMDKPKVVEATAGSLLTRGALAPHPTGKKKG